MTEEALPPHVLPDLEEAPPAVKQEDSLSPAQRQALAASIKKALNILPVLRRGRESVRRETYDDLSALEKTGSITPTDKGNFLYYRGSRAPRFLQRATVKEAHDRVSQALIGRQDQQRADKIREARTRAQEKLASENLWNNFQSLRAKKEISEQHADLFLIMHGLSNEVRAKWPWTDRRVYSKVLKQVQNDQANFEKALATLAKRSRYSSEEHALLQRAIEKGEQGLTEALVREYVRRRYSKKVATAGGQNVSEVINTLVAGFRRNALEMRGASTLTADEARAYARAVENPDVDFSADEQDTLLRMRGGENVFLRRNQRNVLKKAQRVLEVATEQAVFGDESSEWPQLLRDFGWTTDKVQQFEGVISDIRDATERGVSIAEAERALSLDQQHLLISGRALARFQKKNTT